MSGTLKNIEFKEASAQILSIEKVPRILIKWELKESRQNLNKLSFSILRGESPEELSPINATLLPGNTLYQYIDYTSKLKALSKVYYYRVDAIEHSAGIEVQRFKSIDEGCTPCCCVARRPRSYSKT